MIGILTIASIALCFTGIKDENKIDSFLFKIEISGGIMGLNEEILIKNDGNMIFLDKRKNDKRELKIPLNEIKGFENIFYQIKEKEIGKPYPDCIIYKISSKEKRIVTIPSPIIQKGPPLKLLKLINKWELSGRR